MKEKFEIAWRKELLKRLQAPMNTLNRQFEKEQEQRVKRVEELRQYSSPQEAHDAYGYGYITYEEYEQICKEFDEVGEKLTPIGTAREELQAIMLRLKKDIDYFKWESLTDEQKQQIEINNERWREERCRINLLEDTNVT